MALAPTAGRYRYASTVADVVTVEAPGKINLALRVGARRPDGYHRLSTVFCAVSLTDTISASAADDITCVVRGPEAAGVGPAERNLAVRAAEALRRRYAVTAGVHLAIDKQIPVAGGMAGGSADAAGTMVACARLWGLAVSGDDLVGLAADLGADIPFCLVGGCALGQGRGDLVTPALSRGTYHWVLALAGAGLSTPRVFQRYDRWQASLPVERRAPATPPLPVELLRALSSGDPVDLAPTLVNDLRPAAGALLPGLEATIAAGERAGALASVVCGSGPTVAFLAPDQAGATDLAVALSSQGVARRVRVVWGPRPGAVVVDDQGTAG